MKYLGLLLLVFSSGFATADEVDNLRDMARKTKDYLDISIECQVEVRVAKSAAWESEPCRAYKTFAKIDLPLFRAKIKAATASFVTYSKSSEASKRRIKRGLKQLLIIQINMEGIDRVGQKIKKSSAS